MIDLTVVILTKNEEKNIGWALESIFGWASSIIIVDSISSDKTEEICRSYGCEFYKHEFENYAKQRNYALEELAIKSEWIMFLDADERIPPELREEISIKLSQNPIEAGFYIKRKTFWMGTWIRRGYYPIWILRLFRKGKGYCEDRTVNEHIFVNGRTGKLKNAFIHEDHKPIDEWITKHCRYADLEAQEIFKARMQPSGIKRSLRDQPGKKRWLRYNVWRRLPILVRPFIYFGYRYILRGGFLDGRPALAYHLMQGLWFPALIDIKYLEIDKRDSGEEPHV
jgi:glycosyltransferase involved in cell wall biosynthesis